MILFPPAKINLGLNVKFKREDGYHEIESCMLATPLVDVLEIVHSQVFEFRSSGLLIDGSDEENLCIKAFKLLENEHNLTPVYMHLRKNIPMGAGLGGGSADATYVLMGLNTLFDLKLSQDALRSYAAQLGSDCAFFVEEAPQIAKGRGEELEVCELDLKGWFLKLINPEIHISTAEAYSNVELFSNEEPIVQILSKPVSDWKDLLHNSFEKHAFEAHPSLLEIKNEMYSEGAAYVAMSGSGSTMFGLYKNKPRINEGRKFEWVFAL